MWPLWESKFAHSAPPQHVVGLKDATVSVFAEHLDHEDYDVRRNAAFAVAFFGRAGRAAIEPVTRAERLGSPYVRRCFVSSVRVRQPRRARTSEGRPSTISTRQRGRGTCT